MHTTGAAGTKCCIKAAVGSLTVINIDVDSGQQQGGRVVAKIDVSQIMTYIQHIYTTIVVIKQGIM